MTAPDVKTPGTGTQALSGRHDTHPNATADTEQLQFTSPHRFVAWAVLAGFCDPQRLTESILAAVARGE
jgi:hypothetical protein